MRGASVVVAIAVLEAMTTIAPVFGQVDEQTARAVAVLNVAKFVEWSSEWRTSPFVIAVAANDSFEEVLVGLARTTRMHDREIQVRHLEPTEEHCLCQLLFVSAEEDRRASTLLHHARGNSVLTIGETTAFLREGGIVRLFRDDNRLRLQISTKNMESSGLRISSRLLRLAVRAQ
jgi:YfiR/HmsC-like